MLGIHVTAADLRAHARSTLPGFKVPDAVTFGPLAKTSTGKIHKNVLRDRVREERPVASDAARQDPTTKET